MVRKRQEGEEKKGKKKKEKKKKTLCLLLLAAHQVLSPLLFPFLLSFLLFIVHIILLIHCVDSGMMLISSQGPSDSVKTVRTISAKGGGKVGV